MPYNTRRKSLSLTSLGIHVPSSHAARAAAAAANRPKSPSTGNSPSSAHPANMASPSSPKRDMPPPPPPRKLKRTHAVDDGASAEPRAKRRDDSVKYTPPPSPPHARASVEMDDADATTTTSGTIDMDSINDEIVEATIIQLQATGNRPHLVKELNTILIQQLKIVQQSANPCAIISSRLTTYIKRPNWSARSPCPLGKELETVHPRRTYFYLTTCPHQPIPDPAHPASLSLLVQPRTIISPSVSSATSGSEDADPDRRRDLSPSPEVDLSSPEFDDMDDDVPMPSTPIGSLSMRGFSAAGHMRAHGSGGGGRHHHNRAASPPLEKDEKEFTQTADGLQKRKLSGTLLSAAPPLSDNSMEVEYSAGKDDSVLFGGERSLPTLHTGFITSPSMRPAVLSLNVVKKDGETESWTKLDHALDWARSPETVELDELDGLLIGY